MKNKILLAAVLLLTLNSELSTCFAQGALTPPGAPAPTMKTLTQIDAKLEPRTPISSAPFTISTPGSYYLTTNLTTTVSNAIVITANGVTLDLNGFTIASTVASAANGGTAILLAGGLKNVTIQNGFIRGSVTNNGSGVFSGGGFGSGINYSVSPPVNVLVAKVLVSGCLNFGIYLGTGDSTVVEACTTRTVGAYGIFASTVKGCAATDCGGTAIFGDQVSDCRGEDVGGSGDGIAANNVLNSYGSINGSGYGIATATAENCNGYCSGGGGNGLVATTALNCYGYANGSGYGINGTTVQNCYGYSTGNGNGVNATAAQNCYGNSNGNGNGISAASAENCYGICSGSGNGIASIISLNCIGGSNSGNGIYGTTAQNCYGSTGGSGNGILVTGLAIGCYGSSSSGTGLNAFIANSCRGVSNTGTQLSTSHNVNSF